MNLRLNRVNLETMCALVAPTCGAHEPWSDVLLSVTAGRLTLRTGNGTVTTVASTPTDASSLEPVSVDLKALRKILGALPADSIEVAVDLPVLPAREPEKPQPAPLPGKVTFAVGRRSMQTKALHWSTFPDASGDKVKVWSAWGNLGGVSEWLAAERYVDGVRGTDGTRPNMMGVTLFQSGSKLRAVGSDGHRLHRMDVPGTFEPDTGTAFTIHATVQDAISKFAKVLAAGTISLIAGEVPDPDAPADTPKRDVFGRVVVVTAEVEVTWTYAYPGDVPESFEQVFPRSPIAIFAVEPDQILKIAKTVKSLGASFVRLTLVEQTLKLTAFYDDGEFNDAIDVTRRGTFGEETDEAPGALVALNPLYLADAAALAGKDPMVLQFSETLTPVGFRIAGRPFLGAIMPMRL